MKEKLYPSWRVPVCRSTLTLIRAIQGSSQIYVHITPLNLTRGGADSDILMKPNSECSEKPVLPSFSEENQA